MSSDAVDVPVSLRRAAAFSWRLIAIGIVVYAVAQLVVRLKVVVVPVIAALFITTLLVPISGRLRRKGFAPLLATWVVVFLAMALIVGVSFGLYPSIRGEFSKLLSQLNVGVGDVRHWFVTGPLHLSPKQVDDYANQLSSGLGSYRGTVVASAVTGISTAVEVLAAMLLTIVLTFFFVKDGDKMFAWYVGLYDESHEENIRELGRRLWHVLSGYIHGTAVNGVVNATAMTIGLLIIGVPLVMPIAMLTFIGGFLPIVGAFASGAVATLIALVAKGPIAAALVIVLTILIHHLEGYVVGPYVLGRAVRLHPVAILLTLSAGSLIAGLLGAFVAVPLTAILAELVSFYRGRPTVAAADARPAFD